jgi:signal transduction histidine kinase
VFEPFFRGRGTPGVGSGLGLAICRGFVEANGGSIFVDSDSGHGGATFGVTFPIAPQPAPVA